MIARKPQTLESWCASHVVVDIKKDHGMQVRDGWEHHAYTLSVAVNRRVRSGVRWSQGLGVESSPIDSAAAVIASLVSDADAGSYDFEEFCAAFGYDENSRKAYAMWEACKDVASWLPDLIGADYENVTRLALDY